MGRGRRISKEDKEESFIKFGEQRSKVLWKPREDQERKSRCSVVSKAIKRPRG